eukprot:129937_1
MSTSLKSSQCTSMKQYELITTYTINPIILILTLLYTLITITNGREMLSNIPNLCCDCIYATPNYEGCAIDRNCEAYICNLPGYEECCRFSWDEKCARKANIKCDENTTTPPPPETTSTRICCDCLEATSTPECLQDLKCTTSVCNTDSTCCR